jgi:predicted RecB family nuclease
MKVGQQVGAAARDACRGGDYGRLPGDSEAQAIQRTRALIDSGSEVIFEAALGDSQVFCQVDILMKEETGWHLIEVKSSSKVKPEHYSDVGFQLHCADKSGLAVSRASLQYIDKAYVMNEDGLDPSALMTQEEITQESRESFGSEADMVESAVDALSSTQEPEVHWGGHCKRPGTCGFYNYCRQGQKKYDLEFMPNLRQKAVMELRSQGVVTIDEIPDGTKLTAIQKRVRDVIRFSEDYVSPDLMTELNNWAGPLIFIDFESAMSGIPLFAGTHPYQQLPFQWSMHILDGEKLEHREHLSTEFEDPRADFSRSLLAAIPDEGTVLYYSPFEVQRVNELAAAEISGGEELKQIMDTRSVDILKVLRAHVYLEGFNGSFSIKKALPALTQNGFSYEGLAIKDGDMAMTEWLRLIRTEDSTEKQTIAKNLINYCEMDTIAMVEVYKGLLRLARG